MSRPRIRRIFRAAALLVAFLIAVGYGFERWVNSAAMRARLTNQLAQSFGRAVDVESFTIEWFPSIGIEADRVTIAEDPRFGNDYLLRADSVIARPRWLALIAGRLELATIRFDQPSLNVIRALDGRWNVEAWLPAPAEAAAIQSGAIPKKPARPVAHLERIEIENGRVDFRRGNDVRPFALTGVTGALDQSSSGRWQLDFIAVPHRAVVKLQDSGTLRVTGTISGTSARLQPAEFTLTWSDASVADALRLLLGYDSGVRGTMQMQFSAGTSLSSPPLPAPAQWNFTFAAQFANLHGWDLPVRDNDPAVSLRASGGWQAGTPSLDVREILIESAHSKVSAFGSLDLSDSITPHIAVAPSQISWNDLLDAYRAFTPGVLDGLVADGALGVHGSVSGLSRRDISLDAETERVVFKHGDLQLFEGDNFAIASAAQNDFSSMSFLLRTNPRAAAASGAAKPSAESASDLSVFASLAPQPPGRIEMSSGRIVNLRSSVPLPPKYVVRVDGKLDDTEAWLDAARALGKPLNAGWDATGGLELHLAWQWTAGQSFPRPSGSLIAHGLNLRLPTINQPIELADAKLDLDPAQRRVVVTRASAFGARWQGTISWDAATAPLWQFDLAANQLDANDLDRWLGPRARPNWLARMFASGPTPRVVPPAPDAIRARGHLRVASFTLTPLAAQNLQAELQLDGRVLTAQRIQAEMYGGTVAGALEAKLTAEPAYRFTGRADGVNLAASAAGGEPLARRFAGLASGTIELSTRGIGRDQLLNFLEARGRFTVSRAEFAGFDLSESLPKAAATGSASTGNSAPIGAPAHFATVQSSFLVQRGSIDFDHLAFAASSDTFQGSGHMDFARHLDLTLQPASSGALSATPVSAKLPAAPASSPAVVAPASTRQVRILGTLESPRVLVTGPPSHPAAAPAKGPAPPNGVAERH